MKLYLAAVLCLAMLVSVARAAPGKGIMVVAVVVVVAAAVVVVELDGVIIVEATAAVGASTVVEMVIV